MVLTDETFSHPAHLLDFLTMRQSLGLSTPAIINKKGELTTGSPLLDSFIQSRKESNTAYLPKGLSETLATSIIGLQSSRLASNAFSSVATVPTATRAAAAASEPLTALAIRPAKVSAKAVSRTTDDRSVDKQSADIEKVEIRSLHVQAIHNQLDVAKTARERLAAKVRPAQPDAAPSPDTATKATDMVSIPAAIKPAAIKPATTQKTTSLINATEPASLRKARKKVPNPSLERAAAVGMLDLSDKLLFGGEDDDLISTYLGGNDPLLTENDETVVFKYLSKQIAESTLTKIKSRLPLSPQRQLEGERSKVVLDAKNFAIAQTSAHSDHTSQGTAESPSELADTKSDAIAADSELNVDAIHQQIDWLNQRVESLTKELADLTASAAGVQPELNKSTLSEAA